MSIANLGRRHAAFVIVAGLVAFSAATLAGTHGSQKDALAMTEKAAVFLKANGKAKLIERVNAKDPEVYVGDLYLVVLQLDGTHLAHPVNPKLVGKSMLDVPDPEGKLFRKERVAIAAAKGKGWVDYKYKNPDNGKIEQKTAYVMKVDDVLLSVGAYKD